MYDTAADIFIADIRTGSSVIVDFVSVLTQPSK
jgi:hypothetical protein